jgi:hypothetical protein
MLEGATMETVDPSTLGLYIAALTPIGGGLLWIAKAYLAAQRAHTKALIAAARADEALRASIEEVLAEVRAGAAWHRGTVYRPRDPAG